MKLANLTILLMVLLVSSCVTIQPKRIVFNEKKRTYEYRANRLLSLPLRNVYQQLVDTTNETDFREELKSTHRRYPFNQRLERDGSLKKTDFELSRLYGKINQAIISGDFQQTIDGVNQMESIYPDIYKYSDCHFLKGYAFEKMGLADSAQIMYANFMKYSSRKFSSRFHGYRDADADDRIFISERNYANRYRMGQAPDDKLSFTPIKPKYYYGSFQPGFALNSEDLGVKSHGIFMLYYGDDAANEMTSGFQMFYKINNRFNINPRFGSSRNMTEFSLGAPFQLYLSHDNRFGLKFTPFVSYMQIDSLLLNETKHKVNEHLTNFGARFSAGYYPVQNLSIGAYYQYNYYNKTNKFQTTNSQYTLWMLNQYDVSLYYNVSKLFSLKAGVKNDQLVAGIYWYSMEFSYNISHPGLILRVDMY